jgi:hypothetical protein
MMADISKISSNFSSDEKECKDSKFVKYLIKEKVDFRFLTYYRIYHIFIFYCALNSWYCLQQLTTFCR